MAFTKINVMAAVIALASLVDAHMSIVSPLPYGHNISDQIKSPLNNQGTDYPCHNTLGVYDNGIPPSTIMAIGAPQTLVFNPGDTATHGGGSCQISLTTDKRPTKDSKFFVIHSIEGGCPTSEPGNLEEHSANPTIPAKGLGSFPFTIPDGVKPGDYTFAWTWHNKIGTREMYMNCAPITVTTGKKRSLRESLHIKRADSFPDMFIANIKNIGHDDCATADNKDVTYPNPGSSLIVGGQVNPSAPIGGSCGAASASPAGGSDESNAAAPAVPGSAGSSPNAGAAPVASPVASSIASTPTYSPTATAPAASPALPNSAGSSSNLGAAPVASPVASPPASAPAAPSIPASVSIPVPAAPVAPVAAGASNTGSSASGNSSAGPLCSAGKSICSPDGKQIGTCDATGHVTFVSVASGTVCQGGYMVMAGSKRSAKFRQGHVRRGHSLGRW